MIVDDSPIFVEALTDALMIDREIHVVGTAEDGATAVRMAEQLRPDIITMDIHMPGLNGLEAIEQIMSSHPTPILVLTADPSSRERHFCFEALSRGALELIEKPELFDADPADRRELCERIRLLASIPLVFHPKQRPPAPRLSSMLPASKTRIPGVLAIAASTGGPSTICEVMRMLPLDFPVGIVVVQHLAPGFSPHFASWLQRSCALRVQVAKDGTPIEPGNIFVAPDDVHLVVEKDGALRLKPASAYDSLYCPSADVTFKSIAKRFKQRSIGVVLTGMGSDGAKGLLELRKVGAVTIAQDAATSVVDGMPKAARDLDAAVHVTSLPKLASLILNQAEALVRAVNKERVN